MATQELGRIEKVELRDIWPDEAHDFTPWLVDNLDLLGEELELTLELVEPESDVGRYRLDILAKETSDEEYVAIENQLDRTDHKHLGQLLTYAAGHAAGYVVWVAPYFTAEHRATIDWLNSLAPDKVWFYGVEVRAIRIGNSPPAPDFRVMAAPKEWYVDQRLTMDAALKEIYQRDAERYREFFQPLTNRWQEVNFTLTNNADSENHPEFPSGFSNISYCVGFDENGGEQGAACVYLWLTGGRDFTNRVFNELKADHEIIAEVLYPAELDWQNHRGYTFASVSLYMDGWIDDPPEKLEEIRAWMLEYLPKFRDVFNPRLERILAELEGE